MIICDDKARVIYYNAGWPGSAHDNRVWRNCQIFQRKEAFFSEREYLLGDSAFGNSSVMVPAFKKVRGQVSLSFEQEKFNTSLAKVRIKSEHCIGMLKARFPCLRKMNTFIDGESKMKRCLDRIACCMVLHNLLINCDEDLPQSFWDEVNQQIDWEVANEEDEDPLPIADGDECNRRSQVFNYIIEHL